MIQFPIIFLRILRISSLQDDEDDEEVEDLILDTEAINDAVSTFDDVEALEIEN